MQLLYILLVGLVGFCASKSLPNGDTMGVYTLLADDTVPGYTSSDNWQPKLPAYLQSGSNVVFFTFINPKSMQVPPAFANLAKTRGKGGDGSIPSSTVIMFSVGGYSYSNSPNPWPFLTSASAATEMAKEVATWSEKYGCDGIDLDIETGAGDAANVGPNLATFVQVLKQTNPGFIVTQPVFGYPQVAAENYIVNHSWDVNGKSLGLADAVGIMVYQGTGSLQYVKNYAQGAHQWQGFPITVDVATRAILCGMGGDASSGDVNTVANAVKSQQLGGIMVWFASVIDSKTGKTAFTYNGGSGDASVAQSSIWQNAINTMRG